MFLKCDRLFGKGILLTLFTLLRFKFLLFVLGIQDLNLVLSAATVLKE